MRLRIITPLAVVVDEDGVLAVRAEDASGGFGILPGHADFLTSLAISVVELAAAATARGAIARCAAAFLSVTGGQDIAIATREAVPGDDLATLDADGARALPRRYRDRAGGACRTAPACN